jgi:hypothetical protein
MNGFVEECRRAWKRLGVPRSTADEMAAELAADLDEGSLEDVLGGHAHDARSFAREWAAERGLIRGHRRQWIPAAIAVLALIPTVVGAVLLLTDDTSASGSGTGFFVWVASSPDQQPRPALLMAPAPDPTRPTAVPIRVRTDLVTERIRVVPPDDDSNTLGSVLLIAGLALLVPSTLLWSGRVALNR